MFSDFLPHAWFLLITCFPTACACKHSQWVFEMSFPSGSALMASPPTTYPDAIHSGAWIFNSPIIENHGFHPFDASRPLTLWGDWWWQNVTAVLLFSVVWITWRRKKAHEREFQSFILQSLQPYLHMVVVCFDLVLARAESHIRPNTFPISEYSHSTLYISALIRTLQRFLWIIIMENKVHKG